MDIAIDNPRHPRYTVSGKKTLDGNLIWKVDDKFHREDGPAIIRKDGREKFYLRGYRFANEEQWVYCLEQIKNDKLRIFDIVGPQQLGFGRPTLLWLDSNAELEFMLRFG